MIRIDADYVLVNGSEEIYFPVRDLRPTEASS